MNIARCIDHTNLKPDATTGDIDKLIAEALEHGFASVCVNGVYVPQVVKGLCGGDPQLAQEAGQAAQVKACGVAGFPLGMNKPIVKAIEATSLAKDGALEIDFVAHLPNLINKDAAAAKAEFLEIVKGVRAVRSSIVVKVILETACLVHGVDEAEGEARIAVGCQAARESGCDFVKTSTGFHPCGGATIETVKLLKKHSGGLYVKAAGGVRNYDDAQRMIDAGADRLGCSAGVTIVTGATVQGSGY
jgi:deoxyribose-phosphate aldolase